MSYRAVLLDAYGTLIRLDRPVQRLQEAVADELGVEVPEKDARSAVRAEIEQYAAGCRDARDAASLEALRAGCATVLLAALGLDADAETARAVLHRTVVLRPYEDAGPALAMLAGRGIATAVVSNGDCSLAEALAGAGLRADVVIDSATAGAAKPDPAIFELALARLGVAAGEALHVGDSPETDGAGARAAGIAAVIIDRGPQPADGTIGSLAALEALVA